MGNEKGMSRISYSRSGVGMYPILATPLLPPPMEQPVSTSIHTDGIKQQEAIGFSTPIASKAKQHMTEKSSKHKNDPAWRLRQLIPKCKQIRVGGAHPRMNAVDLRALLKRLKLAIVDKET